MQHIHQLLLLNILNIFSLKREEQSHFTTPHAFFTILPNLLGREKRDCFKIFWDEIVLFSGSFS